MRKQRSIIFNSPAREGWGFQGRPVGMIQDGVATTMVTPEMLPIWRHVNDDLITKLELKVAISERMTSKSGGDERWGSKPKKDEVSEATKMIRRFWQGVSKIDRKGLCSLHRPNGGFKVTHGCSTPTLKLSSLVLCLHLCEASLLALRPMVRLYLISGRGPGHMKGGINSTNRWRTL